MGMELFNFLYPYHRKGKKNTFFIKLCNHRVGLNFEPISSPSTLHLKEEEGAFKDKNSSSFLLVSYTCTQWVLNIQPHPLPMGEGTAISRAH